MNRIHRKLEYALIALQHMRQKEGGQLTTAKEICHEVGLPFDATARVMQVMAANGILKSEQGMRGGYSIVVDLDQISLLKLIDIVIGPLKVAKCIDNGGACDLASGCNIHFPIEALNFKIRNFYDKISVLETLNPVVKNLTPPAREEALNEYRQ